MNEKDYETKIKKLLNDEKTYGKLKSDPTNKFKAELVEILRDWNRKMPLTKELMTEFILPLMKFQNFMVSQKSTRKTTLSDQ